MIYVRDEREADWPLHMTTVEQMLPYIFCTKSSGLCTLWFILSEKKYADYAISIWKQFMKGEHTMHHNPWSSNGVSNNMFIESNYMRYGHGPVGVFKARYV